jgi:HlyD family secretion protein
MRPYILVILVASAVGAIGFGAYSLGRPVVSPAQPAPTAAPTAAPIAAPIAQPRQPVVVEARVSPVRSVELTLPVSGIRIAEVLVREGDTVAQGAPLVRLDTRDLQLEIDQARAALAQTRAEYDKLLAGAPPAEIAEAQAQLAEAQAQLAQVKGHVTPQDLAAAQAQRDQARTRLADLQAGARPAEIDQARSTLAETKSDLDKQRSELSAAKEQARRLMEERANDLRTAQVAYTSARQNREQAGGDSTDARTRALDEAVEKATFAMDNAQSALDRAKVEYEASRNAEIAGIARFADHPALAHYAGLLWDRYQSGEFDGTHTRRIPTGNSYLRYYLVEGANSARVHAEEFKAYYQEKRAEPADYAHQRALLFTARKLVRILFYCLTHETPYRPPSARPARLSMP